MKCVKLVMNILVIAIILLSLCEARGGRRGGSFGGLFGSWRKYKKPNNSGGNSRRIVSSSPVHTPITKAWHENKKSTNSDKYYKNMKANSYMTPLPKGASYYQNTAALPGNAIYVAQAPPRGSEFGDFLTGYLTGRLLTMGFSTPHYHVTHIYRDNPTAQENFIKLNSSSNVTTLSSPQVLSSEKIFNAPLMDFSTTTEILSSKESISSSTIDPLDTTQPPAAPSFGVICVPILINERNENGETVQKERTVCYPAPAPPAPQKDMKSKPVEIAGDIIEH